MAYYQQDTVATRLAMDGKKIMRDRVELPAARLAAVSWGAMVKDLGAYARGTWAQHDAQGSVWNAEAARRRIQARVDGELRAFKGQVVHVVDTAMRQAYRHQLMIDHWILDQVTPPNIKVRLKRNPETYHPHSHPMRRIGLKPGRRAVEVFYEEPPDEAPAPDGSPTYATRLEAWLKAWSASSFGGLALAAAAGSDPAGAEAAIDQAKAGNQDVENVMARLIKTQVQVSIADADDDFLKDYEDLLQKRIWTTMDDERVCPICRSQEGLTPEEASYDIPAHPLCRCWWRNLPRDYYELAGNIGADGISRRGMAFRDPETGETAGAIIVSFDGWAKQLTD